MNPSAATGAQTFPRFLLAGGLAALANMASRAAFDLALPYVPSILLAYLVGMATAFLLNRRYVFPRASGRLRAQVGWFVAINLLAVAQTVLVSVALARWLFPLVGWEWHADTLAHVVGVIVPVFTSYLGHKRITFR